jgi:hypothetical protein
MSPPSHPLSAWDLAQMAASGKGALQGLAEKRSIGGTLVETKSFWRLHSNALLGFGGPTTDPGKVLALPSHLRHSRVS